MVVLERKLLLVYKRKLRICVETEGGYYVKVILDLTMFVVKIRHEDVFSLHGGLTGFLATTGRSRLIRVRNSTITVTWNSQHFTAMCHTNWTLSSKNDICTSFYSFSQRSTKSTNCR